MISGTLSRGILFVAWRVYHTHGLLPLTMIIALNMGDLGTSTGDSRVPKDNNPKP